MVVRVGPAGSIGSNAIASLKKIKDSGLDGQEIEFVRQVYMDNITAKNIGRLAHELRLFLSIHASYFVNLCSEVTEKIQASKQRILLACERAYHLGARNVVFHAGYYGKRSKKETYDLIKKEIVGMQELIKTRGWSYVKLCPETTGKKSQFGDLDEILGLSKETGCNMCVDFSHLLAREGSLDYKRVVSKLPNEFHSHFSGIEYSEKGERRHIPIDEKEFTKLAKELTAQKKEVTMICEAPDIFQDALKMKSILNRMEKS